MKSRLLLASFALCASARATLLITEINSNGGPADFWELTNFGASPVTMNGWRWNDDQATFNGSKAVTIPNLTIAPGESLVFTDSTITEEDFREAWELPAGVRVLAGGPGLGQNDAVFLFNAAGNVVTSLSYAAGGFVRSDGGAASGGHAGASAGGAANQSLLWDPNFGFLAPRYSFATGANYESYSALEPHDGVGSPGRVGSGGVNSPPVFTGPARVMWRVDRDLEDSPLSLAAIDTDPGQSVTLEVLEKPAWLEVDLATGTVSGLPDAAGEFRVTMRASDSATPPAATEAEFELLVFHASSPVILNESNAVGSSNFLGGGLAEDEDGGSDPFFGRVAGNGGQWFELAVVGDGSAGSTSDLRGWRIDVLSNTGERSIVLSQDAYWANVISGTLLTFTVSDSAAGGMDSAIHETSALHSEGYAWSNVWIYDPSFIDQAASTFDADGLGINQTDTRFVIRNAAGEIVYGPAGEGVASEDSTDDGYPDRLIGVSSTEALRLEQDPAPGVDPFFGKYDDGNASTFGRPNTWSSGSSSQSFAAYVVNNSPPTFTSEPVTRAYTSYNSTISASDPNGDPVSFRAIDLPDFLELVPGAAGAATLSNRRPLTLEDAGYHAIRLVADDGGDVASLTPQNFTLTVFHDAPTVILNEYNAVAPDNLIGGPDSGSRDTHFGRVPGNGGRWFELVVVGDGGPSLVDLRGWSIEIGSSVPGGFATANVLRLSDDTSWSAVPAGTILTFIDRNSAAGGLDSEIFRRNRLAMLGDAWTNVWIGDTTLLAYDGAEENGYTVSGGVAAPIRVDHVDAQFLIKDAAGRVVFGPVGEGIAPLSGVSSTEVFELEADPRPTVVPFVAAGDLRPGYDDGASGSTFGWPNEWQAGAGGATTLQDFTPFIVEIVDPPSGGYAEWIAGFPGLADSSPGADPDGDGRSNLAEYAFGGNPSLADAPPVQEIGRAGDGWSWVHGLRDDDSLQVAYEISEDLDDWEPWTPSVIETEPDPLLIGFLRVRLDFPAPENGAARFLRPRVTLAE